MLAQLHIGKNIPQGARTLSAATAIRFIGWGFSEAALPIFIYSLSKTYTESALISSVYDIVYIVSLPLVGMLADKKSSKAVILLGLWLYPLISLSYFFAAAYSLVLFVIIARFINGISYALDNVGRQTYFRRHSTSKNASTIFGYFETISNGWWIAASISSIWILSYINIRYAFLAIIPTVLIAISMVQRLDSDWHSRLLRHSVSQHYLAHNKRQLESIWGWIRDSWLLLAIIFFMSFNYALAEFILPINVFANGEGIQAAVLIAVLAASPTIFAFHLSRLAEKRKVAFLGYGIALAAIGTSILFLWPSTLIQLLVAFIIGLAFQLIILASDGLITLHTPAKLFGKSSAIMLVTATLGGTIGMLILGFIVDTFGIRQANGFNLILSIILLIVFLFRLKRLKLKG